MNSRRLFRLLQGIVMLAAPLPLASLNASCGGAIAGHGGAPEGGFSGGGAGGSAGGPTPGGSAGTGGAVSCSAGNQPENCLEQWPVKVPRACVEGELTLERCREICGPGIFRLCSVTSASDPSIVWCGPTCVEGRRPAGFVEQVPEAGGCETELLGAHFARSAQLEAASVVAFRELRRELREYGAPRWLLSALGRAAREERRHTRATRALTRRFGGQTLRLEVLRPGRRSLEAIALENAVEGCVRETYGALVATWRATHARDPVVRAALRHIAVEETSHAALSLRLQRWLEPRLSRAARDRVKAARDRARAELRDSLSMPYAQVLVERAGMPSVPRARALYEELERINWGAG